MSDVPTDEAVNTPYAPGPSPASLQLRQEAIEKIHHAENLVEGGEGARAPDGKGTRNGV